MQFLPKELEHVIRKYSFPCTQQIHNFDKLNLNEIPKACFYVEWYHGIWMKGRYCGEPDQEAPYSEYWGRHIPHDPPKVSWFKTILTWRNKLMTTLYHF